MFFCCKQKTAYEVRISDWSSDVCSSDLGEVEENRDDDEGNCRVTEFERHVVCRLTREFRRVLLLTVEDDGPEDQPPHQHTHDEGGYNRPRPQLTHARRLRGDARRPPETKHFVVDGATRQQQGSNAQRYCQPSSPKDPTLPHATGRATGRERVGQNV